MFRRRSLQIVLGLFLIGSLLLLLFFMPAPVQRALDFLERGAYDFKMRWTYRPVPHDAPIAIIDIDDASIAAEGGSWPWSREKFAALATHLKSLGAAVVAFQFVFPEPQPNLVDEVARHLHLSSGAREELESQRSLVDFDGQFAQSLSAGNGLIGFVLTHESNREGVLPLPTLELPLGELALSNMVGFISNAPLFERAAKGVGLLNASPDSDDIHRSIPLLLRHDTGLYMNLAFQAAKEYMQGKPPKLITGSYQGTPVLEGVSIDDIFLPTDPWGHMLVPFRGPPYSIPTYSATDLLHDKIQKKEIAGRLIFIGSSATAVGQLIATPLSPVFPGAEISADAALSILENYFLYLPTWERGATVFSVILLGSIALFLFPFLSAAWALVAFLFLSLAFLSVNVFLWTQSGIVLPLVLPLFTLLAFFVLDVILVYFAERVELKKIRSIFTQYLPSERIELMLHKKDPLLTLDGESKELTVLFADIRNFTTISETMTAAQVKDYLSRYFTPATRLIFQHKGTIDKYVGDMLMAFWGAPLSDSHHALNSVLAALEIHDSLRELNPQLVREGLPEIHVGIGINTGMMNVGDMGSKFRRSYTVLGDAVNLASRLEVLTKYYHVGTIVGEKSYSATKEAFVFRLLDKVRVKGKHEAHSIYELICAKESASDELLKQNALHEKAMEAYFRRDFKQAEEAFRALIQADTKREFLYQVYLKRLSFFERTPPEKGWDGVIVFEEEKGG